MDLFRSILLKSAIILVDLPIRQTILIWDKFL